LIKKKPKVAVVKRTVSPDLVEIGFAYSRIVGRYARLANHEMLEVSTGAGFANELETAIANGTRRIVFIHGIETELSNRNFAKS